MLSRGALCLGLCLLASPLWAEPAKEAVSSSQGAAASPGAAEAAPQDAAATPVVVAAPKGKNPDPWEGMNRGIYRFNDVLDRYALKPVAKGYKAITPEIVRTGITNFFATLRSPLDVMNDLLQGKVKQAGADTLRFVVNSTVGVVGGLDVGARINLPLHDEDFGQTLGVWGVPSGPYFVMPFFGPSSVRDAFGFGVDAVANPRRRLVSNTVDISLLAVDVVNSRASLLDLESIVQGDRYLFIRDLYLQRREYSVKDGQVDDPFLDDDEGMDEDNSEGAAAPDATAPAEEGAPAPQAAPASPDQGFYEVREVPGSQALAVMVTVGSIAPVTLADSGF